LVILTKNPVGYFRQKSSELFLQEILWVIFNRNQVGYFRHKSSGLFSPEITEKMLLLTKSADLQTIYENRHYLLSYKL
jgi:hypothetical protein